jgi:hypothetical protein
MEKAEKNFTVTVFTPFEFYQGQKIFIEKGPRKGDWEVVGVTERKVKLKCPVSLREFEWNRFCYQVDERILDQWPQKD